MARKAKVRPTLSRAEWDSIFATVNTRYPTGKRDKAMYYFAYFTGIRTGELVYLRTRDVNLARGKFTTPPEGKSGQRKLAFPDSKMLDKLLSDWVKVRKEWGVEDSEFFFCTHTGGRIMESSFRDGLSARAKKVGLHASPHMLRHSYATERVLEGTNALDLMAELGHKHLETTLIYLHQSNERAVENMRRRVV